MPPTTTHLRIGHILYHVRVAGASITRSFSTAQPLLKLRVAHFSQLKCLHEGQGFDPSLLASDSPQHFPKKLCASLPAFAKWFQPGPTSGPTQLLAANGPGWELNKGYLLQEAGDCIVPVEYTRPKSQIPDEFTRVLNAFVPGYAATPLQEEFARFEMPLAVFVHCMVMLGNHNDKLPWNRQIPGFLYLAQASLPSLPKSLQDDLPTPAILNSPPLRGDIYDSSIWMGYTPTYTPLHKDPNPNLFVQLAGSKKVRLFPPDVGLDIFRHVKRELAKRGEAKPGSPAMRGDEMMMGLEKEMLHGAVFDDTSRFGSLAVRVGLAPGQALYIPKGWWHSIIGYKQGINASVSCLLGSIFVNR